MKLKQKLAVGYVRTKLKWLAMLSRKRAAAMAFEIFCTPPSRNRKELPPVFLDAEKLRFKFRQFTIQGYRWNKGKGRKVLIVHGFESSVINFDKFVSPLVKKGHEVLAFDAPAHGRSSGTMINALVYRDFLKYLYRHYGPMESFLAHSFGGLAVCMTLAEIRHDNNYRVALVAPATETKTAIDQFFKYLKLDEPAVRTEFDHIITRISGHTVGWFSIRRAIRHVKAEILWFHDQDDHITPLSDVMKIKNENYSNVRFVITKGLGHRRIYRDSQVTRAIVHFL